ncbi:glutamate-5-semialdehyde dehydrogenase [Streptomyces triticirhizae]|uniref:glutamate-5-semialdehyde dehydrogenase n=1 Tax=Streptomyces triticirhizae TaxID=2483353 RepID=UPI001F2DF37B|nr:glutamate-5-semialdehyde dehydrogenase [Streptomyces triticirhizae]
MTTPSTVGLSVAPPAGADPPEDPVERILSEARAARVAAPPIGDAAYPRYCHELRDRLRAAWPTLLAANRRDIASAEARGLPDTLVTRLRLTDRHLDAFAALAERAERELADLTGHSTTLPAADWGTLRRIPKPLGVVMMVYEARPTVTVDGALLPVIVGNAVLLRGGTEMVETDAALAEVARAALRAAGLPAGLVTVLRDPRRTLLRAMLKRPDAIDVLIPRGSPSLIDYCRTSGALPLIASGGGVNHLYVHASADLALAATVTLDSKIPEPAGCTSVELVLADRSVVEAYTAELLRQAEAAGSALTVRLDPSVPRPPAGPGRIERLEPHDLGREFLDPVIGVLAVSGLDEAVDHIRRHGSAHTEGVLATDPEVTERFSRLVDAAAIVVNGSLRLHDGPKLGLGAEISIATGRLHVRGPVTLGALVTSGWVVEADGELRG